MLVILCVICDRSLSVYKLKTDILQCTINKSFSIRTNTFLKIGQLKNTLSKVNINCLWKAYCIAINYGSNFPCYGLEGLSGSALTPRRYNSATPKPSDSFYPGQSVFTLKLDERWRSCYTAHDGGFVSTAGFNSRLMLGRGLTLEVYKYNKGERVGIRYIKVAIKQDA